ncbi:uncharacterized protein [Primulina eburnea]|uniref:uncharacterized protein n=1 Tax=Primulina eburnea TaxID=1245227 RepID=UPI003C6BDA90
MAFYVPFNDRNLEISFFMLKPTGECADDIIDVLKQVSLYTTSLGCIQSSILKSIHGNLIIWNGAWIKRSKENKILLSAALLSMLSSLANMATLMDHSFFNSYTGESRDGSPAVRFYTGDIVSLSSASLVDANESNENSVAYACLAMFKDRFRKMVGANCGVCLRSHILPRIACLFVWDSLQSCYSYILKTDYRKAILPYLDGFSLDIKYDVFRVVYVSGHS